MSTLETGSNNYRSLFSAKLEAERAKLDEALSPTAIDTFWQQALENNLTNKEILESLPNPEKVANLSQKIEAVLSGEFFTAMMQLLDAITSLEKNGYPAELAQQRAAETIERFIAELVVTPDTEVLKFFQSACIGVFAPELSVPMIQHLSEEPMSVTAPVEIGVQEAEAEEKSFYSTGFPNDPERKNKPFDEMTAQFGEKILLSPEVTENKQKEQRTYDTITYDPSTKIGQVLEWLIARSADGGTTDEIARRFGWSTKSASKNLKNLVRMLIASQTGYTVIGTTTSQRGSTGYKELNYRLVKNEAIDQTDDQTAENVGAEVVKITKELEQVGIVHETIALGACYLYFNVEAVNHLYGSTTFSNAQLEDSRNYIAQAMESLEEKQVSANGSLSDARNEAVTAIITHADKHLLEMVDTNHPYYPLFYILVELNEVAEKYLAKQKIAKSEVVPALLAAIKSLKNVKEEYAVDSRRLLVLTSGERDELVGKEGAKNPQSILSVKQVEIPTTLVEQEAVANEPEFDEEILLEEVVEPETIDAKSVEAAPQKAETATDSLESTLNSIVQKAKGHCEKEDYFYPLKAFFVKPISSKGLPHDGVTQQVLDILPQKATILGKPPKFDRAALRTVYFAKNHQDEWKKLGKNKKIVYDYFVKALA